MQYTDMSTRKLKRAYIRAVKEAINSGYNDYPSLYRDKIAQNASRATSAKNELLRRGVKVP